MSERTYEDGTPAAYEPKVEEWMRIAAEDRLGADATPQAVDAFAKWLAYHAPKPESQPIRRGVVVQAIDSVMSSRGAKEAHVLACEVYVAGRSCPETGRIYVFGFFGDFPASNFVRIGRARYYPDGTVVED